MIRKIVPQILFISLFLTINSSAFSKQSKWQPAKEGNKIILIRHALAPGGGDPKGFKLDDCKTQRNLNKIGINQSKKIGNLFKKNKIKIDKVLSSQWCRCKDTAMYAFKKYEEFPPLNSTFSPPFDKNEKRQIQNLKSFVQNWNSNNGNLVLVTHYVVILAVTGLAPSSGEIVITDKDFKVLSTIDTF
tara:strand:- start:175 stop:738 length:564 start_codon:yes stop_codon:yes gene_type:complete